MKRLAIIVCCLFVIFAGAASAWADCKQLSAAPGGQNGPGAAHTHGHHADGNHPHSEHAHPHDAVIHCPIFEEFIITASFSTLRDHRVQRLLDTPIAELHSQSTPDHFRRLTNGPPVFASFSSLPSYLALSALRI
jgi:hypothetical protein